MAPSAAHTCLGGVRPARRPRHLPAPSPAGAWPSREQTRRDPASSGGVRGGVTLVPGRCDGEQPVVRAHREVPLDPRPGIVLDRLPCSGASARSCGAGRTAVQRSRHPTAHHRPSARDDARRTTDRACHTPDKCSGDLGATTDVSERRSKWRTWRPRSSTSPSPPSTGDDRRSTQPAQRLWGQQLAGIDPTEVAPAPASPLRRPSRSTVTNICDVVPFSVASPAETPVGPAARGRHRTAVTRSQVALAVERRGAESGPRAASTARPSDRAEAALRHPSSSTCRREGDRRLAASCSPQHTVAAVLGEQSRPQHSARAWPVVRCHFDQSVKDSGLDSLGEQRRELVGLGDHHSGTTHGADRTPAP